MKHLTRIISHYRLPVTCLIAASLCRAWAMLLTNRGYAEIVNAVFRNDIHAIERNALYLVVITIIQCGLIYAWSRFSDHFAEKVGHTLRTDAVEHILTLKYGLLSEMHSGERISRLNNDLPSVVEWLRLQFSGIILDVVFFIVTFIAMLIVNWRLTIAAYAIIPLLTLYTFIASKPITASETNKQNALSRENIVVKSVINGFETMKLYDMSSPLVRKGESDIDAAVAMEQKASRIKTFLMNGSIFVSLLPLFMILGLGAYFVITGKLKAGTLLAFLNMSSNISVPLMNLPDRITGYRTFSANVSRVTETNDELIKEPERRSHNMEKQTNSALAFKHVYFSYIKGQPVLHDISFTLPIGGCYAIVGESGCGKSTLLKLLTSLYNPDAGDISVLGISTQSWQLKELRAKIAVVTQDAQLFPVSILENITCGHNIGSNQVNEACKAACLTEFISSLPNGINTQVSEQGEKFSGGQRQRINIARAIAKDAPILLLDEATSALDSNTEKKIITSIEALKGSKSILIITHRMQIAAKADKILCIHNGLIVESGSHEQLIQQNGYYARLYNLQQIVGDSND